jgi:hypothetical protein
LARLFIRTHRLRIAHEGEHFPFLFFRRKQETNNHQRRDGLGKVDAAFGNPNAE